MKNTKKITHVVDKEWFSKTEGVYINANLEPFINILRSQPDCPILMNKVSSIKFVSSDFLENGFESTRNANLFQLSTLLTMGEFDAELEDIGIGYNEGTELWVKVKGTMANLKFFSIGNKSINSYPVLTFKLCRSKFVLEDESLELPLNITLNYTTYDNTIIDTSVAGKLMSNSKDMTMEDVLKLDLKLVESKSGERKSKILRRLSNKFFS